VPMLHRTGHIDFANPHIGCYLVSGRDVSYVLGPVWCGLINRVEFGCGCVFCHAQAPVAIPGFFLCAARGDIVPFSLHG
jgi:hypothetical protein